MTSFFQIFTVLISNYVNSNCFIFNLFSYFVLIAWQHTVPFFFIQITENMFTFLHATIFACRIPAPSLWIFLKDLSVFKITEKCSIYYYFLFRMYCVVTRFSLRLSCDQNFGKYVCMVKLQLQRVTVGVLCSFSDLSFRIQLVKLLHLVSSFIYNIYSPGS